MDLPRDVDSASIVPVFFFFLSPVLEVHGRKGPLIQIGSRKYPLLHDLRHMTWEIRNWKYGSEEPFMVL